MRTTAAPIGKRRAAVEATKSLAVPDTVLKNQLLRSPWVEKDDPSGSGMKYFWNQETNETTHVGSPKPKHWLEVKDPEGSELTYWWDAESGETTALGFPKPSYLDHNVSSTQGSLGSSPKVFGNLTDSRSQQNQTLGGSMVTYATLGFGMTGGIILVRMLFGI